MSGLKFVLDRDFTYGINVNEQDQRITAGSLILVEPAKDSFTGIPAAVQNYAHESFTAITGNQLQQFTVSDTITAKGGIVERTSKGAIHVIPPKDLTSQTERARFSINNSDLIKDYILANLAHSYYFAVCGMVTRDCVEDITLAGIYASANGKSTTHVNKTTNINQYVSDKRIYGGPLDSERLLARSSSGASKQAFLVDVAHSSFSATTLSVNDAFAELATFGARSLTTYMNNTPAWAIYSLYFEDLTVSGQTYAQAHAKSQDVFNSRFGMGGIYANDTWTIPT